jgi:hypothetical protein
MSKDHQALLELRLEIARIDPSSEKPIWELLDFARDEDDTRTMLEIRRIFERFSRIVISLKRQATGQRAHNEPYRDLLGVRCRLQNRVLGVWPSRHDAALTLAPLAPASLCKVEHDFEAWRTAALQRGAA